MAMKSSSQGVHLWHIHIFCELISRKCEMRFCELNFSINFKNLSSDLNIFYTVVNSNLNTYTAGADNSSII